MRLLGGVAGGVFLVMGDRVHFGASATRETIGRIGSLTFPMSLSEFSRHRPVLAQVLETRAPASAADLEIDARTTQEAREFARAVGFRSNAVVPMLRDGELFTELQGKNQALSESLEQQTATSEILRVISSSPTDVQPVHRGG